MVSDRLKVIILHLRLRTRSRKSRITADNTSSNRRLLHQWRLALSSMGSLNSLHSDEPSPPCEVQKSRLDQIPTYPPLSIALAGEVINRYPAYQAPIFTQ